MPRHLALLVRLLWCMVGIACGFCGLWLTVFYFWKGLWNLKYEYQRRDRRLVGMAGGLLLCAAAVIFISLFC